MEKNLVKVVYDGRTLPPSIEKALICDDFNVSSVVSSQKKWCDEMFGISAVILSLENAASPDYERMIGQIKLIDENLPVIIVSKFQKLEHAVSAMRSGAFDCLTYPIEAEKLKKTVFNAIKLFDLTKRVYLLESQMGIRDVFDDMVGISAPMQEVFNMISMVAKSNATVLITGESGTGKELVARAIHRHSLRAKKTFIDINCGAIPRELLENELFGHEKGSYTGADKRYTGSCERADGGTLFLDEISEMDPLLQVKLLRFLQERNFVRVGGDEQIRVDVRIVAATNRDIAKDVAEGRFREDLFYRLNVVPIHIPALRERKEDIPLLAKSFLEKYSTKNEKIFLDFASVALEALISYDWPGNVRELENIIERIVVLNNDSRVKPSHLPNFIRQEYENPIYTSGSYLQNTIVKEERILPLEMIERYAIEAALKKCLGNVSEAARKLKVGQATLYRKIKEYGLR